jgi:pimeloyl-ACP methyl ester carboxylesterase
MTDADYLNLRTPARRIAYRKRPGAAPTILFLPGYASDMDGAKAVAIDSFAAQRGQSVVRFDYSGTGLSSGDFADGSLALWLEEALAVADKLAPGPFLPVGSSMGGWLAFHLALARPKRAVGVVGIAAAPDFTQWGFSESQKQQIAREGVLEEDNPYGPEPSRIYRDFWESAQEMRLLEQPIDIELPVRLIHGEEDPEVPIDISTRLMRQLRSADVQLNIIKKGGHRLSEPHEIRSIVQSIAGLLET